jgi:hypothetical protein
MTDDANDPKGGDQTSGQGELTDQQMEAISGGKGREMTAEEKAREEERRRLEELLFPRHHLGPNPPPPSHPGPHHK